MSIQQKQLDEIHEREILQCMLIEKILHSLDQLELRITALEVALSTRLDTLDSTVARLAVTIATHNAGLL